jgi:hypothetical protein
VRNWEKLLWIRRIITIRSISKSTVNEGFEDDILMKTYLFTLANADKPNFEIHRLVPLCEIAFRNRCFRSLSPQDAGPRRA